MSEPAYPFSKNICDWLKAAGFQCRYSAMENGFSGQVEIYKSDQILLSLIIVDLAGWRNCGAREKLDICFEYISSGRIKGAKCILLWEDYWIGKKAIVQSRILAMLGVSQKIPARLTSVRRIDQETASNFLKINHLNGSVSSKTRYGLFLPTRYFRVLSQDFSFDPDHEALLVAVATFSHPRIFKNGDKPFRSCELIRFSSLLNSNVVGGLDKLLRAFVTEKKPDDIMTYADLDWSDGGSYARLGFDIRGFKQPETYYLNSDTMERSLKPGDVEGQSDLDGHQKMVIYNMGSIKYVKVTGV